MDEILIDEKRYVSSKRAAKMTGYAKDYIGQLCREGRVPARLVGRSWYVLETAIQDHRFGAADVQGNEIENSVTSTPVFSQKWESPRYEASSEELLTTVERQEEQDIPAQTNNDEPTQNLQDSWKAWFDQVAGRKNSEDVSPITENTLETEETTEEEKPIATIEKAEGIEVNIPIHSIYQHPPQELLPHSEREDQWKGQELPIRENIRARNRTIIKSIQTCSVLIAGVATLLAIIGSGYLDKNIISISPARIIAGVELYTK